MEKRREKTDGEHIIIDLDGSQIPHNPDATDVWDGLLQQLASGLQGEASVALSDVASWINMNYLKKGKMMTQHYLVGPQYLWKIRRTFGEPWCLVEPSPNVLN